MKASDFGAVLRAIADMLGRLRAGVQQEHLAVFARIFEASPAATVAAVVKRLRALEAVPVQDRPTLGDVAEILAATRQLIATLAKPAVRRDVELVEAFLRERSSS